MLTGGHSHILITSRLFFSVMYLKEGYPECGIALIKFFGFVIF